MNPLVADVFMGTMPPKTTKKITISADQGSIQAFFHKPAPAKPPTSMLETQAPVKSTNSPQVEAFMASLTPSERIAHAIAVEKLGTSYDITRTHGFVRWSHST
jgi:hypothetical protein